MRDDDTKPYRRPVKVAQRRETPVRFRSTMERLEYLAIETQNHGALCPCVYCTEIRRL